MLGFNHTLAGSIVAVVTPVPLVPVVAFISHYLLDLVPHYGDDKRLESPKTFRMLLATDGVLCAAALFFAIWLFPTQWFMIGVGAFFAVLPDLFWVFLRRRISKSFDKFLDWAGRIQWGERPYGWIYDFSYGLMFVLILVSLGSKI